MIMVTITPNTIPAIRRTVLRMRLAVSGCLARRNIPVMTGITSIISKVMITRLGSMLIFWIKGSVEGFMEDQNANKTGVSTMLKSVEIVVMLMEVATSPLATPVR